MQGCHILAGSIYIYGNVGCGFYTHTYGVSYLGDDNGNPYLLRRHSLSREMSIIFTPVEKGWEVTPYQRLPVLWASLDALP